MVFNADVYVPTGKQEEKGGIYILYIYIYMYIYIHVQAY